MRLAAGDGRDALRILGRRRRAWPRGSLDCRAGEVEAKEGARAATSSTSVARRGGERREDGGGMPLPGGDRRHRRQCRGDRRHRDHRDPGARRRRRCGGRFRPRRDSGPERPRPEPRTPSRSRRRGSRSAISEFPNTSSPTPRRPGRRPSAEAARVVRERRARRLRRRRHHRGAATRPRRSGRSTAPPTSGLPRSGLLRRAGAPARRARRLRQAYVIAHESATTSRTCRAPTTGRAARARRSRTARTSSRCALELQADCYAGVWAATVFAEGDLEQGDLDEAFTAAEAVGDDRLQEQAGGASTPTASPTAPPSSAALVQHGYERGDPAACDTFSPDEADRCNGAWAWSTSSGAGASARARSRRRPRSSRQASRWDRSPSRRANRSSASRSAASRSARSSSATCGNGRRARRAQPARADVPGGDQQGAVQIDQGESKTVDLRGTGLREENLEIMAPHGIDPETGAAPNATRAPTGTCSRRSSTPSRGTASTPAPAGPPSTFSSSSGTSSARCPGHRAAGAAARPVRAG